MSVMNFELDAVYDINVILFLEEEEPFKSYKSLCCILVLNFIELLYTIFSDITLIIYQTSLQLYLSVYNKINLSGIVRDKHKFPF